MAFARANDFRFLLAEARNMRSILDELRQRGAGENPTAIKTDVGASLRADILANLARLLSTPRGSAVDFPDLGMTDATQVFAEYPDAVVWMQQELLSTIEAYEPRLSQVRIEHVPTDGSDLRLQFRIHAMLRDDGSELATSFVTSFNSDNHVTFR